MIYAIADLHLDSLGEKPMDIFGENWIDHEEKIFAWWAENIADEDLVLLPGDISWALKLEESRLDLEKIDRLPGRKIIIKGNHDYWWESFNKVKNMGFKSIGFLQNTSEIYGNYVVAGTRGWSNIDSDRDSEDVKDHNQKIFARELNRLRLSLESIRSKGLEKIVILHYPPFDIDSKPNEFMDIMLEFGVKTCIYGHLHGDGHKYVVEGEIGGIQFHCVASDYIDFVPKLIKG